MSLSSSCQAMSLGTRLEPGNEDILFVKLLKTAKLHNYLTFVALWHIDNDNRPFTIMM